MTEVERNWKLEYIFDRTISPYQALFKEGNQCRGVMEVLLDVDRYKAEQGVVLGFLPIGLMWEKDESIEGGWKPHAMSSLDENALETLKEMGYDKQIDNTEREIKKDK